MDMDESLIAAVEFKKTGANVHNVICCLSTYKLAAQVLMQDVPEPFKTELTKSMTSAETKLRQFVATGVLSR